MPATCRFGGSLVRSANTGLAPHQWLVQQRIAKAKDLLTRSSQSLADIASDCGFSDQSHFTRVFLRAVGATPAEWRRLHRQ
jgi:AraC family transcriptional regulator